MPTKTSNFLITLCAAAALSVIGATASSASALVDTHNGTGGNTGGSGDVDVLLNCSLNVDTETCTKTFFKNETHVINWSDRGFGTTFLEETIVNSSGTPWTDFHWAWEGFDSVELDFDVNCSAGGNAECIADFVSTPTSLDILFFAGLVPGNGTDSLEIKFGFEGNGVLFQYPTFGVPEPGTLAILGLGLAGLGLARRRKRIA